MQKPKQYLSVLKRLQDRRQSRFSPGKVKDSSSHRSKSGARTKGKVLITASLAIFAFMALIIGIPSIAIYLTEPKIDPIELEIDEDGFMVQIHRSKEDIIVELPLEKYIRGVVAAEMPANFELEALKAQALAARTYFIHRWSHYQRPISDDYRIDQAYLTDEDLKARWGGSYTEYSNKINQAINETKGLILTYENQPIEAYFFSTSNGHTENSEDVWSAQLPYLRSVESPWDTISPKFHETKVIPIREVHEKLGLAIPVTAWSGNQSNPTVIATKRSDGKRIMELQIGDQTFTGREVREKLGLNSTHFTISIQGDSMQFSTYGYGHGVGMSQWGAEALAREGMRAEEITKYFYQGVAIEPYVQVASLLPKLQDALASRNNESLTTKTLTN